MSDELFSTDFVDHNASNPGMSGLDNIKRSVADWPLAFPNTTDEVEDLVAEWDMVAARWVIHCTHRGEFLEIFATSNRIEVTATGIFRISKGKLVEGWDHFDALGMLAQLGAMPEPKEARD